MTDKVLQYGSKMNSPLYTTGFKNKLVNGNMKIAQRGTTVTSNTSGGIKTADRWKHIYTTGNYTSARRTDLVYGGITYPSLRMTMDLQATDSGTCLTGISQVIDGYTASSLRGKTATLSFICKVKTPGTYSIAIRSATNNAFYVTNFTMAVADTSAYIQKSIYFDPTLWNPSDTNMTDMEIAIGISGGPSNTTAKSPFDDRWLVSSVYRYSSNTTHWSTVALGYIEITNVQLEVGSVATDYEYKDYFTDLLACQRDYQIVELRDHVVAMAPSTSIVTTNVILPVAMRTATDNLSITNFTIGSVNYNGTTVATTTVARDTPTSTTSFYSLPLKITLGTASSATSYAGYVNIKFILDTTN